jgi:hypothetical protein
MSRAVSIADAVRRDRLLRRTWPQGSVVRDFLGLVAPGPFGGASRDLLAA